MAFPPARSISLTTDAAASAPFVYVMATFAPSEARRLAIAAPMPREPPVISATFPSSCLNIVFLLSFLLLFESPAALVRGVVAIVLLGCFATVDGERRTRDEGCLVR